MSSDVLGMPGSVVLTYGDQWRSEQMWVSRGFSKALECDGQRGLGQKRKVPCMMGVAWTLQGDRAVRQAGEGRGAQSHH